MPGACAPISWEVVPPAARSTPKKRAFGGGRVRKRTVTPARLTDRAKRPSPVTFAPGEGERSRAGHPNLHPPTFAGGERYSEDYAAMLGALSGQLDRINVPASAKALFFGGSTPFLWASAKEMGSKRQDRAAATAQRIGAHAQSDENKRGNPRRGFPLRPPPALL
jgi:hypothetical protein